MKTTVRYPADASKALAFLTSRDNDIAIFVEDEGSPNLWVKLLANYVPQGVKLTSVHPLGSKEEVVRACKGDQERDGRKRLYIIDGDLDLIRGRRKPRLRYLYRLRGYCVENYLVEKAAIASAIATLNPREPELEVQRAFDLGGWVARNEDSLRRLFVCYGVSHELQPEEETVGYSVHRLIKDGGAGFDLCGRKVFVRTMSVYREVRRRHTKSQTREAFERVRDNAVRLGCRRFASGKDYIFPLLYKAAKAMFRVNISVEQFCVLVAECSKGAEDGYLRRRLEDACRAGVGFG